LKASKRGNDVYCCRVRNGFRPLFDLCSKGLPGLLIPDGARYSTSRILFVTLTWNPALCLDDPKASWRVVPALLNEFISKLKAEYGDVSIFRVFEAFVSGYPHVHLLVIFNDHKFPVHYYRNAEGDVQYLIPDSDDELLHDMWFGQHVKAEALKSLSGVLYLLKYVTKGMHTQKGGLTSALLWVHHSRSYGISNDFIESLSSVVGCPTRPIMRNSNGITPQSVSDCDFRFVGMVVLPVSVEIWRFVASDPPMSVHSDLARVRGAVGYSVSFVDWLCQFADPSVLPESRLLNPNTLCNDPSDLSIYNGTYYPDR